MKKILFSFIFLICLNSLPAKDLPFSYERLWVHFNGITINQNTALAYGDGGIVLRSPDKGKNWEQIAAAADDFTIMNIKCKNNSFYGILDKDYIIISDDDGKTWSNKKISDMQTFLDFDLNSNNYFILTNLSILVYDLNFNLVNSLSLDYQNQASELKILDNSLYVPIDNGRIYVYDINNKFQKKTIDFGLQSLCSNCPRPNQLKSDSSNLYIALGNYLLKSKDNGTTWSKLDSNVNLLNVYKGNYYSLSSSNYPGSGYSFLDFYKSGVHGFERVNHDTIDRYIPEQIYKGFEFLGNDSIIAVGKDKLISISYDGGKNWTFISNFRINYFHVGIWLNENKGYLYTSYNQISKTSNGGVTWLPQKYKSGIKDTMGTDEAIYADTTGLVILFKNNLVQNGINFIFSDDFGENYNAISKKEMIGHIKDPMYNPRIIRKDTNLLFFFNGGWGEDHYTMVYLMDNKINVLSQSLIDSMVILDARLTDDGKNIMALGYERKYPNNANSFDSIKYYLMYSYDNGNTWVKDLSFALDSDSYNMCTYIDKNYLIISTKPDTIIDNGVWSRYSISILNPSGKIFQKKVYSDHFATMTNFFKLNDIIYNLGYYHLYLNNNFIDEPLNWQKDSTDKFVMGNCFWSDNQTGYVGMTLSVRPTISNFYKIKAIKPTPVDEPKSLSAYLYSFPPYPTPATNEVSFVLYWDYKFDITTADFAIFDIMGNKIAGKNEILIYAEQPNNGIIKWNCSNVQDGIYFIRMIYGGNTKAVPIIVKR